MRASEYAAPSFSGYGGQVNDSSVFLLTHDLHAFLRTQEQPEHIYFKDFLHIRKRHIFHRYLLGDPCVIDQHINASVFFHNVVYHLLNGCLIRHVYRYAESFAAQFFNLLNRVLHARFIHVCNDNRCLLLCKRLGNRLSNSLWGSASCYNYYLTIKIQHLFIPPAISLFILLILLLLLQYFLR